MFPTLTFLAPALATVEISTMENRPRGGWCYMPSCAATPTAGRALRRRCCNRHIHIYCDVYFRHFSCSVGYVPKYTGGLLGKYRTEPYRSGSVRPKYPAEHFGIVRYEPHAGTRHFGKFGTTYMPVPDTSVISVP